MEIKYSKGDQGEEITNLNNILLLLLISLHIQNIRFKEYQVIDPVSDPVKLEPAHCLLNHLLKSSLNNN